MIYRRKIQFSSNLSTSQNARSFISNSSIVINWFISFPIHFIIFSIQSKLIIFFLYRCRATILKQLTAEEQIDQLCLPLRIKQYISEGLENFQEDVALQLNNQMTHW